MADDDRNEKRSQKAKEEFEEKKQALADQVRLSDKDETVYMMTSSQISPNFSSYQGKILLETRNQLEARSNISDDIV